MKILKHEINLFLLALGFFSRIPIPVSIHYSPELLNRSSRYFTMVGWLLGFLVAAFFSIADYFFSTSIALWLCMVFSLLLTGAFHEDGLADASDGFGGGYKPEKILVIMKDSRIGTFGAATLIMALIGKFHLLLENSHIAISLLVSYALSRATAASLLFDMPYVSDTETSKSKPLANNHSINDLSISLATAAIAFLILPWQVVLQIIVLLVIIRTLAKWYFLKKLGGYTGDCLGATQQVAELSIYLLLVTVFGISK